MFQSVGINIKIIVRVFFLSFSCELFYKSTINIDKYKSNFCRAREGKQVKSFIVLGLSKNIKAKSRYQINIEKEKIKDIKNSKIGNVK